MVFKNLFLTYSLLWPMNFLGKRNFSIRLEANYAYKIWFDRSCGRQTTDDIFVHLFRLIWHHDNKILTVFTPKLLQQLFLFPINLYRLNSLTIYFLITSWKFFTSYMATDDIVYWHGGKYQLRACSHWALSDSVSVSDASLTIDILPICLYR